MAIARPATEIAEQDGVLRRQRVSTCKLILDLS
jgi:hypothetical protein